MIGSNACFVLLQSPSTASTSKVDGARVSSGASADGYGGDLLNR